jgi:hypothetical protein
MAFLRHNAPTVPLPTLYAFEGPGSPRAVKAGAPYMLIEGFYGNSLQDVAQSVYNLPVSPNADYLLRLLLASTLTSPRPRLRGESSPNGQRSKSSWRPSASLRSAPFLLFPRTQVLPSDPWP